MGMGGISVESRGAERWVGGTAGWRIKFSKERYELQLSKEDENAAYQNEETIMSEGERNSVSAPHEPSLHPVAGSHILLATDRYAPHSRS